jgi:AraC family transcriptional regulator of adaptative response / DNA-3-methyladenine glycosylase II
LTVERLQLDPVACFRAMASRDRRFEGRFVAAVRTTRVYCRPGCPAPLPKPQNVAFFAHAAAAEAAGFRPCRRCRPELSPTISVWPDTSRTVTRAIRLIANGALDGDASVSTLAASLGVGERHLRRLFSRHLGASPIALAQTCKIHLARRLLDETTLSITDIALSAGFSSVRRFNDVFRRTFAFPPSGARSKKTTGTPGEVCLRLPFIPPYDWASMLEFLRERRISGVEAIDGDAYRRSVEIDGAAAGIEVRRQDRESCLTVRILARFPLDLLRLVDRVRRLFDLDCDPRQIGQHLGRDLRLAASVRRHLGLRLPGAWDPFEMTVRAILGQQISVRAASTLAGRLAATFGTPVAIDLPGVTHQFPGAARLVDADLRGIGVTGARTLAIQALARAVAGRTLVLDGSRDVVETIAALRALPGVGDWTAQYVAMRALRELDALPAGDLGLTKALSRKGKRLTRGDVLRTSERWRPFRAYAVMHLWRTLGSSTPDAGAVTSSSRPGHRERDRFSTPAAKALPSRIVV